MSAIVEGVPGSAVRILCSGILLKCLCMRAFFLFIFLFPAELLLRLSFCPPSKTEIVLSTIGPSLFPCAFAIVPDTDGSR